MEMNQKIKAVDERGQSMVLLALMIMGLAAFVGLAVDVGLIYMRSAQLTAAVDAATLAGVVELHSGVDVAVARAEQFLNANGWSAGDSLLSEGAETFDDLGLPEFTYTVTWSIDTNFMRILGITDVPVTRSATAAYRAQIDMPLPTFADQGRARLAGQFVAGPNACTYHGDPITPLFSSNGIPNPQYPDRDGKLYYRIRVSEEYYDNPANQNLVRVQLFDPDSVNNPALGGACTSNGVGDECYVVESDPINPVTLVRVDETWLNPNCPVPVASNPNGNTVTRFMLFYYDNSSGEQQRVDIAAYQTSRSPNPLDTDLRWVTPSGSNAQVPTDFGSFDVDLSNVEADNQGFRHVFLEVDAIAGSSINGWDLWAGPTWVADAMPSEVNSRNQFISENPALVDLSGVQVYALGYLPLTFYRSGVQDVPVGVVDAVQGGGALYASIFDLDGNASGPVIFTFDTVSSIDFNVSASAACGGSTNCNNLWVNPYVKVGIPTHESNPPVAFFGGYLMARYNVNYDKHTWSIAITSGRPYLTK